MIEKLLKINLKELEYGHATIVNRDKINELVDTVNKLQEKMEMSSLARDIASFSDGLNRAIDENKAKTSSKPPGCYCDSMPPGTQPCHTCKPTR